MTGGLTISGGEPLMQHRFAVKLFAAAQEWASIPRSTPTAIYGDRLSDDELETIDLVCSTSRRWDPERHRQLTGMDIGPTLEFARRLAALQAADLAALRARAGLDRRCRGHRARSPSSRPAWATSSASTCCRSIRWAASSGSGSARYARRGRATGDCSRRGDVCGISGGGPEGLLSSNG